MRILGHGLFCILLLSILGGCGLGGDSCLGTLYRSPSLYTGPGGTIYVSYYLKDRYIDSNGSCVDNPGKYSLIFSESNDDGASWTKKILVSDLISNETTEIMSQSLAVNTAGYIFVSYVNLDGHLVCTVSKDGGDTFTPVNLDTTTEVNGQSIINDNNSNIYIAYNANNKLKVVKYNAGTDTWGTPMTVDSTSMSGYAPSITVTGNNRVFISYYYRGNANVAGLKFATSVNSGSSWTLGNIKVADNKVSGPLSWIISDTYNYIYVAFYEPNGYDGSNASWTEKDNGIFKIAKSTDYGLTWTFTTVDDTIYTGKSVTIVPGMGGTNINVCYGQLSNYKDASSSDNQILCTQSTNGGTSFSAPYVVDTGSFIDYNVADLGYLNLAMDFYNSSLYMVYSITNLDGSTNLKLARSTDGLTWTKTNIY